MTALPSVQVAGRGPTAGEATGRRRWRTPAALAALARKGHRQRWRPTPALPLPVESETAGRIRCWDKRRAPAAPRPALSQAVPSVRKTASATTSRDRALWSAFLRRQTAPKAERPAGVGG